MIFLNKEVIKDPVNMSKQQIQDIMARGFSNIRIIIPEHIVTNKDKKEYKTGFANEAYSTVFPSLSKTTVFSQVTKIFDIFVEERQYQNMVRDYNTKKYTTFIKI